MTDDAAVDTSPVRVLFVDDHALVTQSFRRALEREDDIVVVATAAGAAAGHEAALAHRPDVILMDYLLPDGNGAAAAASILRDLPETKVILLTGSGPGNGMRAALSAGCVGYLEKTCGIDAVVSAVRAVANGAAILSYEDFGRLVGANRNERCALTPREREILALVAEGLSNQAIAERLVVNVTTVRKHVQNTLTKLHAHSRLEAVAVGRRLGLFEGR